MWMGPVVQEPAGDDAPPLVVPEGRVAVQGAVLEERRQVVVVQAAGLDDRDQEDQDVDGEDGLGDEHRPGQPRAEDGALAEPGFLVAALLPALLLGAAVNAVGALEADGGVAEAVRARRTPAPGTAQPGRAVRVPQHTGERGLLGGGVRRLVHDGTNLPKPDAGGRRARW